MTSVPPRSYKCVTHGVLQTNIRIRLLELYILFYSGITHSSLDNPLDLFRTSMTVVSILVSVSKRASLNSPHNVRSFPRPTCLAAIYLSNKTWLKCMNYTKKYPGIYCFEIESKPTELLRNILPFFIHVNFFLSFIVSRHLSGSWEGRTQRARAQITCCIPET